MSNTDQIRIALDVLRDAPAFRAERLAMLGKRLAALRIRTTAAERESLLTAAIEQRATEQAVAALVKGEVSL